MADIKPKKTEFTAVGQRLTPKGFPSANALLAPINVAANKYPQRGFQKSSRGLDNPRYGASPQMSAGGTQLLPQTAPNGVEYLRHSPCVHSESEGVATLDPRLLVLNPFGVLLSPQAIAPPSHDDCAPTPRRLRHAPTTYAPPTRMITPMNSNDFTAIPTCEAITPKGLHLRNRQKHGVFPDRYGLLALASNATPPENGTLPICAEGTTHICAPTPTCDAITPKGFQRISRGSSVATPTDTGRSSS